MIKSKIKTFRSDKLRILIRLTDIKIQDHVFQNLINLKE